NPAVAVRANELGVVSACMERARRSNFWATARATQCTKSFKLPELWRRFRVRPGASWLKSIRGPRFIEKNRQLQVLVGVLMWYKERQWVRMLMTNATVSNLGECSTARGGLPSPRFSTSGTTLRG